MGVWGCGSWHRQLFDGAIMVENFRQLRVYREAFRIAQRVFELSKRWPREERYALTDQIRRSSRSVCANTAEAWHKRRYPKHFISKLSDANAEAAETQTWLDFALDCDYLDREEYDELNAAYDRVIGGLVKMMASSDRWCGPSDTVRENEESYLPDV